MEQTSLVINHNKLRGITAPPSPGAQNCTAQAGGTAKSSFGPRVVSVKETCHLTACRRS